MPEQLNPNVQFRNLIGDLADVIDEAILNVLDSHHPDDRVLTSLAEARGGIVRMQHAVKIVTIHVVNDHDRMYADELPPGVKPKPVVFAQPNALPKLKPVVTIRVGLKTKTPREFDCERCGAKAGDLCFRLDSRGIHGKPTEERLQHGVWHDQRQKLARNYNDRARRNYDREHGITHEKGINK